MRKNKDSDDRSFRVNPYFAVLMLSYNIFMLAVYLAVVCKDCLEPIIPLIKTGDWSTVIKNEDFQIFVFLTAPFVVNFLLCYYVSDQAFGVLTVNDDCIILRSPLKFRKKILYDEIRDIGIDIGTTGAFWIYISRTPIPNKYRNRINRIPLRKCYILFAYSDRAYKTMCKYLPPKIGKRFAASASIIRLYENKSR